MAAGKRGMLLFVTPMSYEDNLKAALAANALVKNELRIRSSNRPSDIGVATDFMNEMTNHRSSLKADFISAKKLAKGDSLEVEISQLTIQQSTNSTQVKVLTQKQISLGMSMASLKDQELKDNRREAAEVLKQVVLLRKSDDDMGRKLKQLKKNLADLDELNPREDIEVTAQASVDKKKGNCDEMSSIAYLYLRSSAIRPIDLFETGVVFKGEGENRFEDKHQFVVIGRGAKEGQNAPTSWSQDAVVCDPWAEAAYPARNLHEKLGELGYPTQLTLRMRDDRVDRDADEP
jgi:hypothetical protein